MFVNSSPIADGLNTLVGLDSQPLQFYERGDIVPPKDQGCWQIYRGVLQVSQWTLGGDEVLMGWAQPGSFVGLDFSANQRETYQIRALTDVYLRGYSLQMITNNAKLCRLVLDQTLQQVRQREALLAIAGYKRVDERLQGLLNLLGQELGQPTTGGLRLSVRLTHQMLANAIGTTRVTVTRLLGEFQAQGKVSLDGDRHLVVALEN
ncbi:Crp/Fnr family transcriptional regulator [Synechocystis salina]|uniref:Crp/Fnr family transcriptional regulator n=1 Tax=Synechocystis salina LEGE 00031 TaxID=1828736 RepID=A0ABR9VNG5_9SYNC|nr:Crp/Fnr family transcriptional regulator [Synechocystis salina]MBE9203034.1 Crp/Fnr family transcriptional regulator [Synechocystis salina LEGE 06099]MBE9240476.1 Crp/Fnr family transcriptional regulator [Synechocystis salina LEGE 00041]MBE9252898.1 Crp/Fnr family transcriptional regulator [Synechocystis salina LEGE 00031]